MTETKNGLSTEYISHPGDTLSELLEQYGISQKELSIKTQTSEKHINEIVKGKKSITVSFAKKLENVFKPDSSFWINRQSIYDEKIETIRVIENISLDEKEVAKEFPTEELVRFGYLDDSRNIVEKVLNLRKFAGTSNLLNVPEILDYLLCGVAFKKDATSSRYNPYKYYSWLRMCQIETEYIYNPNVFAADKLKQSLFDIKRLSLLNDFNDIETKITSILFDSGINFKIVRSLKGLPVQGYIKTINSNISLCVTTKWHSEDVFWFTLFHEIGHLLHKRNTKAFLDFNNDELEANSFARDFLIKPSTYQTLINNISERTIKECAKQNSICPAIVVGRLSRDGYIEQNEYKNMVRRIIWQD